MPSTKEPAYVEVPTDDSKNSIWKMGNDNLSHKTRQISNILTQDSPQGTCNNSPQMTWLIQWRCKASAHTEPLSIARIYEQDFLLNNFYQFVWIEYSPICQNARYWQEEKSANTTNGTDQRQFIGFWTVNFKLKHWPIIGKSQNISSFYEIGIWPNLCLNILLIACINIFGTLN